LRFRNGDYPYGNLHSRFEELRLGGVENSTPGRKEEFPIWETTLLQPLGPNRLIILSVPGKLVSGSTRPMLRELSRSFDVKVPES
jgi:hypothetical protein